MFEKLLENYRAKDLIIFGIVMTPIAMLNIYLLVWTAMLFVDKFV